MALVGGARFSKTLKVETVMPNRLKIELDLGEQAGHRKLAARRARSTAQWLSGATAANLRANVEVRLSPVAHALHAQCGLRVRRSGAQLQRRADHGVRRRARRRWQGEDRQGSRSAARRAGHAERHLHHARVRARRRLQHQPSRRAPWRPSTATSGLKLPKGDAARDMLLTDTRHTVELATLDRDGKPVSVPRLQVTLYKVQWRWWWDSSGDSLAQYAQGESTVAGQAGHHRHEGRRAASGSSRSSTRNGAATWCAPAISTAGIARAGCSTSTGRPGPARRATSPAPRPTCSCSPPTSRSTTSARRPRCSCPKRRRAARCSRSRTAAPFSKQRWIEAETQARTAISIPITAGMAPNIYVAVTMVQPHAGKDNDRPIRLYGVIPLKVTDPQTQLTPVVTTAAEWAPQVQGQRHGERIRRPRHGLHAGRRRRRLVRPDQLQDAQPARRVLPARGAGRLHLGPVR